MYLIKKLNFIGMHETVAVENGIEVTKSGEQYSAFDQFWGETDLKFYNGIDMDIFEKRTECGSIVTYADSIETEKIGDGFKKITLHISEQHDTKTEDCDGYLVIINRTMDLKGIKTDGQIYFQRYPQEIVAFLQDGNSITFEGKTVRVINGKLLLEL